MCWDQQISSVYSTISLFDCCLLMRVTLIWIRLIAKEGNDSTSLTLIVQNHRNMQTFWWERKQNRHIICSLMIFSHHRKTLRRLIPGVAWKYQIKMSLFDNNHQNLISSNELILMNRLNFPIVTKKTKVTDACIQQCLLQKRRSCVRPSVSFSHVYIYQYQLRGKTRIIQRRSARFNKFSANDC